MIEDFTFLIKCPVCDAIFWPENGKLMRASTTPQEDCSKCLQLQQRFKEGDSR